MHKGGNGYSLYVMPYNFQLLVLYTREIIHKMVKVNVKVKLSLCSTKHHAMEAYWESGDVAPRILDLGTRWS
jgi:hypothetical protein